MVTWKVSDNSSELLLQARERNQLAPPTLKAGKSEGTRRDKKWEDFKKGVRTHRPLQARSRLAMAEVSLFSSLNKQTIGYGNIWFLDFVAVNVCVQDVCSDLPRGSSLETCAE